MIPNHGLHFRRETKRLAVGASWNTLSQNNITRSQYGGIVLNGASTSTAGCGSSYNTVVQNFLMDNFVGVEVSWWSNYNNLTANTISYNGVEGYSGFGVYICEHVWDTGVYNNYISHNFYGVYLFDKVGYLLL